MDAQERGVARISEGVVGTLYSRRAKRTGSEWRLVKNPESRVFYTKLLRKIHIFAQFGLYCLSGGRFFQFLTFMISHLWAKISQKLRMIDFGFSFPTSL